MIQEKEQRGVELQANIKSERTDSSSQEENERLKSHLKHVEEELIRMVNSDEWNVEASCSPSPLTRPMSSGS